MDSSLTGAKFSSCIGFAMAGSSPVISRRSESQACMESYSIDLNKRALDLNGMAMISSEVPLRFELYPVVPGQANAAYAYAATNFLMQQQPVVVNPWIEQAAGPYFWAPQIVGNWNHSLSNHLDCFQKPRRSDGGCLSAANIGNGSHRDSNDASGKHQQSKVSEHVLNQDKAQPPHADDHAIAASKLQGLHANHKTLKPAKDQLSVVNDQTLGTAKTDNPHVNDQLHPRFNNAVARYQQSSGEIIESPDWLPPGWITEVKTRKSGSTAGSKDKYYLEPVSCHRFRSKNEVLRYLQTGQISRYRSKVLHHEGTGGASASSFMRKSSCNAGAQSSSSHHVGAHSASLCGIESQPNFSACSVPLAIQSDTFCKVASTETTCMASSIPCISNQSLETNLDSLNEVLPVGHSDRQNISNCNRTISPVNQSAISVQLPSLLDEVWQLMDNTQGEKEGTSMDDGSDPNVTSQKKGTDSFFQRMHGANVDGCSASFKQQRIHEAVGEGQQEIPDGMLNPQIGNPATPLTSTKHVGNARQSSHCINGNAASRSGTSTKQAQDEILGWKNVTLPTPSQPLKDTVDASQLFQDTTENNINSFGPPLHLKGSYINPIGLKKTQKLKSKQRKELLAVLGRKLCWQGLGLLVHGVQTLPC